MKKVVIIGGGVAGLSLGLLLKKNNFEVVISEKNAKMTSRGHAFLMHIDGWSILEELKEGLDIPLPGEEIGVFCLNNQNGVPIKKQKLNLWRCIKRRDLIQFLYDLFPAEQLKGGRAFSHFIYENDKVVAAVFQNGEVEYGDIFVGADGAGSAVREATIGPVPFTAIEVKEVVGISSHEKLGEIYQNVFTKFQYQNKGLSFGMIPVSKKDFVWFMQYSVKDGDCNQACTPEELKAFCEYQLADFPPVVAELLSNNDYKTSYIWNTRDFGLLPKFHHKNVVFIGDAAHLALPFTSAGTTNAILDAHKLTEQLLIHEDCEAAFTQFYDDRKESIEKHINLGRELKELFVNPSLTDNEKMVVPLISKKIDEDARFEKLIDVQYFTDPICSTCWVVQPLLRKLKLEYGAYFNIEYRMGGLLPSWDDFQRGAISKPSDVAPHWEEVCLLHGIPLDGDIWLEDPLPSSYPPSIAFKAAQMQDADLAVLFLRRIKEMLFLEKKNIVDLDYLEKAAFEVGLDSARFLRDYESTAEIAFREDLIKAQDMQVGVFPTLIFTNKNNEQLVSKGYQEYEYLEQIIHELVPNAKKRIINSDPMYLFGNFSTMTNKEYSFLSNTSMEETENILLDLYTKGYVDKYESKNGIIWKSKLAIY
ncbi:DsbA family protein [Arcicella rigui]|uniref:DsbA family protein n=1 Tax=Arcicella rigui TaxID=797020 RepID=A0ABU5QCD7_9BACT|nr:DsbA family protein [Arcicella rigui]MEA5140523.1 DsbA family protein [Arcicella rigui]